MRSPLRRSCLVAALDAQKLTRVSNVEPISLDGHHGLYVEMRVPRTVDVDRCDDGYYMFWEGKPGDAQHTSSGGPGSVERLWILDVDGDLVVLAAIAEPGVPEDRVEELTAMAESVRFVDPE